MPRKSRVETEQETCLQFSIQRVISKRYEPLAGSYEHSVLVANASLSLWKKTLTRVVLCFSIDYQIITPKSLLNCLTFSDSVLQYQMSSQEILRQWYSRHWNSGSCTSMHTTGHFVNLHVRLGNNRFWFFYWRNTISVKVLCTYCEKCIKQNMTPKDADAPINKKV